MDKFTEAALKYAEHHERVAKWLRELKKGDIFYAKDDKILFQVIKFSAFTKGYGSIQCMILAENTITSRRISPYEDFWMARCLEWERVPREHLPLYINFKHQSKAFHRALKEA